MTIGEKIKKIRLYRGYSQAELAKKVNIADTMMRDYEYGIRTPKEDRLREIAKALGASYTTFAPDTPSTEVMETLFWLEETIEGVDLFSFQTENEAPDIIGNEPWHYKAKFNKYNLESWIRKAPIGIAFHDALLNSYLENWLEKKQELSSGKITEEAYFDWKINWPESTAT